MEQDHIDDQNSPEDKLALCRLCHGSTNVTVHIGEHFENKSTSIVEKIHYCTSLIVKVGDDFPQKICKTCFENLNLLYDFKSKAILCDLELSKKVHRDINFTYIQVSDDPLNMTYKLDLEEQDSSADLGDSCVYNIIDGDELTIEPVNVSINNNKSKTTVYIEENDNNIVHPTSMTIGTSGDITNKLNENINSHQDSKTYIIKENITVDHKRSSKNSINDEKNKPKKIKTENDLDNENIIVIVKNGKVVFICGVCDFEAESMVTLHSHRSRVHLDMDNYKCPECPTYYKTLGLLKRHTTIHHSVTHICKYCDKKCLNKQGLDRHINFHHNVNPLEFQCVKCNAYFDTMDKMEDHLVVHYTNPSNSFKCNHCDRSFTTYVAKNKHIYLEHMIEIECDICHVVLPSKEAMDKHNNSVHQPKKKENKMYACTTCGKYFTGLKDILNHRETHIKI